MDLGREMGRKKDLIYVSKLNPPRPHLHYEWKSAQLIEKKRKEKKRKEKKRKEKKW